MRLAEPAFGTYLVLSLVCGGSPLVCAVGVCAAAWRHQTSVLQDLDAKIAVNDKRIRELSAVKPQVDALVAKKVALEDEIKARERAGTKSRSDHPLR